MKRGVFCSILAGLILFCVNPSFSATINVPGDSATIQAGINGAVDGDTVLVADGTYTGEGNRDILLQRKAILVTSENGPESTIVNCEGSEFETHRGFILIYHVSAPTVLEGFTIMNGYITSIGGAIACGADSGNSTAIIKECIFLNNYAEGAGAISFTDDPNILLSKCIFVGNQSNFGGAIRFFHTSSAVIENCVFYNNTAIYQGGAIRFDTYDINDTIRGCTFVNNSAPIGACIDFAGKAIANISNTIIAFNPNGGSISLSAPGPHNINFECTDIFGNVGGDWIAPIADQLGQNGNFSADPLFCDTLINDFTLLSSSPCAPENNDCGESIGAYGIGCDDVIGLFGINNEELSNVVSHTPELIWTYADTLPEDSFVIAVGIDDDWIYTEMWNPPPFIGPDTSVIYSGATLIDGETYYMRLKVHNSIEWSIWYYISFRMNSIPSVPIPLRPLDDEVTGNIPMLWTENSTDVEGDNITYDFSGFHDTDCVAPNIDLQGVAEGTDSTGGQIIDPLGENCIYWWSARAFDGYEYSDWSTTQRFYIDGTPEPPTAFQIQYPPDTSGWYVFDMLSDFSWEKSYDLDPFDSVYYTLQIAIDSNFQFVFTIDSLWQAWHTLTDSLNFGTQYWWKVKATDNTGLFTYSSNTLDFKTWKLGDANGDWQVNIFDITFIITYLYLDGPAPGQLIMGDVNGDCVINIFDITYLITYLYIEGPAPQVGCE